jgi:hypothetical protein
VADPPIRRLRENDENGVRRVAHLRSPDSRTGNFSAVKTSHLALVSTGQFHSFPRRIRVRRTHPTPHADVKRIRSPIIRSVQRAAIWWHENLPK